MVSGPVIRRFLIRVLVNAVAMWAADYLLDGFSVVGGPTGYLVAGGLLAVLNAFVRPVVRLLALPLILVTFGLFTLVINGGILWLVAHTLDAVTISGALSLVWATLIVSTLNMLLNHD